MTLPLHERIRADVQARILSGALSPGDRVPTEHALMADYGCSRMTVSKALSALAAAGLIDRRRRAGSFVAPPRLHAMVLDVPDLAQEVVARGQSYAYQPIARAVTQGVASGDMAFDVGPGHVLALEGLHLADGRPLAAEQRRISLAAVPESEAACFDDEPPGSWLLRHVPWTEAETRISALAADATLAARLLVEPGAALLRIERRTWRGGDPITAVSQCFRAGAYDLFARFAARDIARR